MSSVSLFHVLLVRSPIMVKFPSNCWSILLWIAFVASTLQSPSFFGKTRLLDLNRPPDSEAQSQDSFLPSHPLEDAAILKDLQPHVYPAEPPEGLGSELYSLAETAAITTEANHATQDAEHTDENVRGTMKDIGLPAISRNSADNLTAGIRPQGIVVMGSRQKADFEISHRVEGQSDQFHFANLPPQLDIYDWDFVKLDPHKRINQADKLNQLFDDLAPINDYTDGVFGVKISSLEGLYRFVLRRRSRIFKPPDNLLSTERLRKVAHNMVDISHKMFPDQRIPQFLHEVLHRRDRNSIPVQLLGSQPRQSVPPSDYKFRKLQNHLIKSAQISPVRLKMLFTIFRELRGNKPFSEEAKSMLYFTRNLWQKILDGEAETLEQYAWARDLWQASQFDNAKKVHNELRDATRTSRTASELIALWLLKERPQLPQKIFAGDRRDGQDQEMKVHQALLRLMNRIVLCANNEAEKKGAYLKGGARKAKRVGTKQTEFSKPRKNAPEKLSEEGTGKKRTSKRLAELQETDPKRRKSS